MNCIRCHRPLKNPGSIIKGMGPICAGKAVREAQKAGNDDLIDLPWDPETMDIVFKRDEAGKLHFNIAPVVSYHSPSGFEWGYAGSGPADFALNILQIFIAGMENVPKTLIDLTNKGKVFELAWHLHQHFKFDFIAGARREGGTIKGEAIRRWITAEATRSGFELAP